MTSYFLIDKNSCYTYDLLLDRLSNSSFFYPALKNENLFLYFLNLILGLINNQEITLVDADLSDTEMEKLGISNINTSVSIEPVSIENLEDLRNKIETSSAKIIIFTSGTTGQPKKISHSVQTLIRQIRKENHESDIWGFTYNPTHMAALQVFFQALLNGNKIVNLYKSGKKEIYKSLLEEDITHISGTPTFFRLLLPPENRFNYVKRITLGGEKSDIGLYNSLVFLFPNAKINNVYASTEAGSLLASSGSNFVIPLNLKEKIKVVKEELYVHKSLVGDNSDFRFIDDFYPTGDMIEWVDKEREIFKFKNRKNELLNVGGYKVNPHEVEDAVRNIPGVINALVYGKRNSVIGTVLCADIKLENSSDLNEPEIKNFLKERLQDFKIPRKIKFVDKLEVTRTGKLKRI